MAAPAVTPPPLLNVDVQSTRPISDFDAGHNASNAWTEHLERESTYQSISDEEREEETTGRPARALYDFEGRAEFRELTVNAGDSIEVLKQRLPDGWSLVSAAGQVGLLPESYYTVGLTYGEPWSYHKLGVSDLLAFSLHRRLPPTASMRDLEGNTRKPVYLVPQLHILLGTSLNTHFTTNFAAAPGLHARDPSNRTETPNGGTTPRASTPPPLDNQRTGEWSYGFPNFRQSLLGGKSLNRFSSFVTTGAEEFVLKGPTTGDSPISPKASFHAKEDTVNDEGDGERMRAAAVREADQHFVEAGPAWKPKLPEFKILVHSPSKRSSTLGAYTIYNITSIFTPDRANHDSMSNDSEEDEPPPTTITVHRRFSHFVFLHTALTKRLPGIALPPLPEKQYAGRFSDEFVEARRGDLERYMNRIVRHPVARYAEVVTFFLSCESELEWRKQLPYHLNLPPAGPQFYARVYHPAFNLDQEDASESVERFERHIKAMGKGVQGLRGMFSGFRAARLEMSKYQRLFSYSLLSLITSTPLASAPQQPNGLTHEDEEEEEDTSRKGLMNADGAWCWRENCEDCLRLTKALQRTAEGLQSVADLYDDNARRTQLNSHEALKDVAHPSALYAPVIETHNATLSRFKGALQNDSDETVAARCETVLNTTMAEFETYHAQKLEDFERLTVDHLDGEIEFYEQVLSRLRTARANFVSPQWEELSEDPRQPSMYERDLAKPRLSSAPLPEPCPHVWDSAPMRPVSVALQEGVGMLFGSSASLYGGRGSVFGKFW